MSNWMRPYNDLDPSQIRIVGDIDAPINENDLWLIGYPGSGKSVVLAHLARKSKLQGKKVAVVTYTKALGSLFNVGFYELNISGIPVKTPKELIEHDSQHYDYIICDEIQDLSLQTFREIKDKCNYLIAAGDANQSIYEKDIYDLPVMEANDPARVLHIEPNEQNIIYRLTRTMVETAIIIRPMLADMRNKINLTTIDTRILKRKFDSADFESSWIYDDALRFSSRSERTAILFSTKKSMIDFANKVLSIKGFYWNPEMNKFGDLDFNKLNSYLISKNIKMECVLNSFGSLKNAHNNGRIILTTYHSAKGLDFENVYLPYLNKDLYLLNNNEKSKTLLMVALTRSSKNLTLSYSSREMSDYISPINTCIDVTMNSNALATGPQNTNSEDDDMF